MVTPHVNNNKNNRFTRNNEVHTLFTDVCNNEGITMSQKINQLVTDCVSFPSKTENKVESEPIKKNEKRNGLFYK